MEDKEIEEYSSSITEAKEIISLWQKADHPLMFFYFLFLFLIIFAFGVSFLD